MTTMNKKSFNLGLLFNSLFHDNFPKKGCDESFIIRFQIKTITVISNLIGLFLGISLLELKVQKLHQTRQKPNSPMLL